MGTKNAPGDFDCYANAEPDEPMFVLLARDPLAPVLVNLWAHLRSLENDVDDTKIDEANDCSSAMQHWRLENRP